VLVGYSCDVGEDVSQLQQHPFKPVPNLSLFKPSEHYANTNVEAILKTITNEDAHDINKCLALI